MYPFWQGEWIKEGAAVIDVGINAVPDATKKAGHRSALTPPPLFLHFQTIPSRVNVLN
jgi:hypothetical protein